MIRVLHTADWHIGQLFHEYDRSYEHQQFLDWLSATLLSEQVDVLLISGDVFDVSNPSAGSVKIFYSFLNRAVKQQPHLQIVVTAGNHDSAARLESPKPLLESSNIHIVGLVSKDQDGAVAYNSLTIPLRDREGNTGAWCIAAPFLRIGDYPHLPDSRDPYADGVAAFYQEAFAYAASQRTSGQAIIAMGHLHAQQAVVGDMDKSERLIMGGVEAIGASALHSDLRYVALGHIHKAQWISQKEHIRYSGSPLPMSFSETHYKHQVVLFDIEGDGIKNLHTLPIPLSVSLLRIPSAPAPLTEVLTALELLQPFEGDQQTAPFLEVRILLDGPAPGLRHKVEAALGDKNYRLAKIDVRYPTPGTDAAESTRVHPEQLDELSPIEVFQKVYHHKFNCAVPEELQKLFVQVTEEVNETTA